MSHENPFLYIGGLIALLVIGYGLLAAGLDMGVVIMLIIALIAAGIGGSMIMQRYKRMGKHAFYNKMISGMDPSLPLPFPEHANEIEQTISPYHFQGQFDQYDEAIFGGTLSPSRPGNFNDYMTYSAAGSVSVNEQITGPDIRGNLPQGRTTIILCRASQSAPLRITSGATGIR